jgi:cobalt-zinc-cadmium efflux system protein
MAHDHPHSHDSEGVSDRVLLWSILINAGLSVFEFAAGAVAGSVALMADALHNTNDAAALLIAYIARKVAGKVADHDFTFGYRRAELIGAMIQLTALIVIGLYLIVEAARRFFVPEPLLGEWMMAAAGVALLVDAVTAWLLWAMAQGSLNVRAAFLHNLTDAGASVAVLFGGAAVVWLGWNWVDPLLTLVIAGYILWMSFGLLRRTSVILMEGTPAGLSIDRVKRAVETIDGVLDMHHIHLWEVDECRRALEAHIVIAEDRSLAELEASKAAVKRLLEDRFDIVHSTLEMEVVGTPCRGC